MENFNYEVFYTAEILDEIKHSFLLQNDENFYEYAKIQIEDLKTISSKVEHGITLSWEKVNVHSTKQDSKFFKKSHVERPHIVKNGKRFP